MDGDLGILAAAVRRWTGGVLPGDDAAADRAVEAALVAVAGGASMSEACAAAQQLVRSWSAHPSRHRAARRLAEAS